MESEGNNVQERRDVKYIIQRTTMMDGRTSKSRQAGSVHARESYLYTPLGFLYRVGENAVEKKKQNMVVLTHVWMSWDMVGIDDNDDDDDDDDDE